MQAVSGDSCPSGDKSRCFPLGKASPAAVLDRRRVVKRPGRIVGLDWSPTGPPALGGVGTKTNCFVEADENRGLTGWAGATGRYEFIHVRARFGLAPLLFVTGEMAVSSQYLGVI